MSRMTIEKSWYSVLKTELEQPYVQELKQFLSHEHERGQVIYPPEDLIFNALRMTPYDSVKVVVVGQDPYHGPRQAHGLSFSVPKGVPVPPSLKNIYKELSADVGATAPDHGCLEKWSAQGVLLLNATLTVRARQPKSHYGRGWERFTDAIVKVLAERERPMVFMLWGKSAQEKCANILDTMSHPHLVLTAAHPSPYSASNFLGCRHFSKANEALKKWGETPIDWLLC